MKNRIAIWTDHGMIRGVRSTIQDLEVEIVDADDIDIDEANAKWEQLTLELPFANY